jgi:hypothetical protein
MNKEDMLGSMQEAREWMVNHIKWKVIIFFAVLITLSVGMFVFVSWYSQRPNIEDMERIDVVKFDPEIKVIGYRTFHTMEVLLATLLTKRGGFIANDKLPPFSMSDDMSEFELGAIEGLRETAIVIRRRMTRSSGAQSVEDKDAVTAQTNLNIDTDSWMFPSVEGWSIVGLRLSEGKYQVSQRHYKSLKERLIDDNPTDGNFYARTTSLIELIDSYNRVLGSHSQRLSASVGRRMISSTAGDKNAEEAKYTPTLETKTEWSEIDNVFWNAMGAIWVMEEMFDAVEYDFAMVLKDKQAVIIVNQIREELKRAQQVIISPVTLNGNGYGMFANHSLALANYISRASATMIDLKRLLENG